MFFKFTLRLILSFVIAFIPIASTSTWNQPMGGAVEKNPNDVIYTVLAQKALVKYANDNGDLTAYNVLQVTKASEQIVEGTFYRIDFIAVPTNCYMTTGGCTLLSCHADIVDVPWEKKNNMLNIRCTPSVM